MPWTDQMQHCLMPTLASPVTSSRKPAGPQPGSGNGAAEDLYLYVMSERLFVLRGNGGGTPTTAAAGNCATATGSGWPWRGPCSAG
jgi:hypothetical protein